MTIEKLLDGERKTSSLHLFEFEYLGHQFQVEASPQSGISKKEIIIDLQINSQDSPYGMVTGILRDTQDGLVFITQYSHNYSQDKPGQTKEREVNPLPKVSGLIAKVTTEILLRNIIKTWFSDTSTNDSAKKMYENLSQNNLLEVTEVPSPNHSAHLGKSVFAVRKKHN